MTTPAHSTPAAEGAIRFRYRLAPPGDRDRLARDAFARVRAWRQILKRLQLIGRHARRYDGYGYGNLSVRDPHDPTRFYVTASQTSGAPRLRVTDLVRIDRCDVDQFEVDAVGDRAPSSESITHGMVYAADPAVAWIMHAHAPAIWRAAACLGLATTPPDVEYGSRAMALAVEALLAREPARPLLFATLGHTDGVFACGTTADDAGALLVRTHAAALARASR
ncbi:MAG TPA: class II aldolase/adducin family protein [Pseudomonadales bacterium]|nr:class II aldolase/adducin family protein [Pseudomonadales bacterium]